MQIDQINDFVVLFLGVVWEALPFIVLGALIAGTLEELLPQDAIAKILPRHFLPAILLGGLLGLVFPMCECGIVVVMRRLLKKGLPLSCCVSYMLAGPIVNVVVIMSTWYAFEKHKVGIEQTQSLAPLMVGLRCGMGFLVACVTGVVVHFVEKRSKTPLTTMITRPTPVSLGLAGEAPAPRPTIMQRINNITSTAVHDFMDITVFLIIGSILASLIKTNPVLFRSVQDLSQQQPVVAILAMMGLAVLLCLCSEADAFLAASFSGMSVSARLSFLVLGPMLDLKLLLMYTRVFRPKLIAVLVTCTVLQVAVYSIALHYAYNPYVPGSPQAKSETPQANTQPSDATPSTSGR